MQLLLRGKWFSFRSYLISVEYNRSESTTEHHFCVAILVKLVPWVLWFWWRQLDVAGREGCRDRARKPYQTLSAPLPPPNCDHRSSWITAPKLRLPIASFVRKSLRIIRCSVRSMTYYVSCVPVLRRPIVVAGSGRVLRPSLDAETRYSTTRISPLTILVHLNYHELPLCLMHIRIFSLYIKSCQ